MALLENFVNGYECLESLNLISENRLYFETAPERRRGVVIPGIYNALYIAVSLLWPQSEWMIIRTPDVFLFRCRLVRTRSFLNIYYKFMLGLLFIHRSGWIVHFLFTVSKISSTRWRSAEPTPCQLREKRWS